MAKLVVLGVSGEKGFWLVDLDQGTVKPLTEGGDAPFGYTSEARGNGAVLTAGIDLAVQVSSSDDAFGGRFDTGPYGGRFDG